MNDRIDRLVIRSVASWWLIGFCAAIGGFFGIDAIVRDRFDVGATVLVWVAAVCWGMYLVLVRPSVVVTLAGLELVNPFRRHTVPWSAVRTLSSRWQLRVELTDGRTLVAWGAPTSGRGRAPRDRDRTGLAASRPVIALPPVDQQVREWVDDRRERAQLRGDAPPAAGGEVESNLDVLPIAISLLIAAGCASTLLAL